MMQLRDFPDTPDYCNRKSRTTDDDVALETAARILGKNLPKLPDEDLGGTSSQKRAMNALGTYLDAMRLRYFDAEEATRPNHRDKARNLGWEYLVPPVYLWPWFGLTLSIADICREALGRSIRARNLWRPLDYNALVGGADEGDHPDACGIDLDFSSHDDQRVAEGVLRVLYPINELQLSVGLGGRSLHVGILSQRGRRRWFYSSATPEQRRGFRGRNYAIDLENMPF